MTLPQAETPQRSISAETSSNISCARRAAGRFRFRPAAGLAVAGLPASAAGPVPAQLPGELPTNRLPEGRSLWQAWLEVNPTGPLCKTSGKLAGWLPGRGGGQRGQPKGRKLVAAGIGLPPEEAWPEA